MTTSELLKVAWVVQPSDSHKSAAMIVDAGTESHVITDRLDYGMAQHICRIHNALVNRDLEPLSGAACPQ